MTAPHSPRTGPGDRHLVLQVRRPGQRRRQMFLAVLVMAGVAWGLFRVGTYYGVDRVADLEQEVENLQRQLQLVRVENEALHQDVVQSRQSASLDADALREVNATIRDLEERNAKLRKELSFLRGIVTPGDAGEGLQVRELVLEPGSAPNRYRFSLLLAQAGRHDRPTEGRVTLRVKGEEAGKEREVSGKALAMDEGGSLKFRFRYFQMINSEFGLPTGFKPQSVWVEARAGGKAPEKKAFPWPLEEDVHAGQ